MGLPVITRKGSLQQLLFLRRFVKSPVIGLVNTNRWETKQNKMFSSSFHRLRGISHSHVGLMVAVG